MFSRSFCERLILMMTGSFLTYYVATLLMKESMLSEYEDVTYNGRLKLNTHEKILHNSVVSHDEIDVSFDNIVGHTKAKQMIESIIVHPMTSGKQEKFSHPNGMILHGPPGTGKTMLVKALCKRLKVNFILFEQSFVEQKMFGESAKMIKALFSLAKKLKPCVIFIDEIDGIFAKRTMMDQSFVNGIKTQMLMHMDGFKSRNSGIVFVGATNRLDSIDPALLRRMRTHIYIPLPDYEERISMFKNFLCTEDDFSEISTQTAGFSGSDIYELCKLSHYSKKDLISCLEFM